MRTNDLFNSFDFCDGVFQTAPVDEPDFYVSAGSSLMYTQTNKIIISDGYNGVANMPAKIFHSL